MDKKQNQFVLPINFLSYKQKLFDNLYDDLELIDNKNGDESVYETTFKPATKVGKLFLPRWSNYYTTDKKFLRESHSFYKNISDISQDKEVVDTAYDCWNNLKSETNFCEKYYYLEWDRLKFLNKSSAFLSFLSFYNIASPALNLMAPFTLLLVPFFMLKVMKMEVTFATYKEAMMTAIKRHAIGKLFLTFNEVELSQKVYFSAMIGLYFYNIYQNAVTCYRFYKNLNTIIDDFNKFKTYLEQTIEKITYIQTKSKTYESYGNFRSHLEGFKQRLQDKLNKISIITISGISIRNLSNMGKIMATFYDLYCDNDTDDCMRFSFEFNGYFDTLCGLRKNIDDMRLNPSKFSDKNKVIYKVKKIYYPMLSNKIITNDIDLRKNIILTGPNAAGKTTLLKSSIINLLFIQQIGYGYFKSAEVTPFDYIHSYINIPDTSSRDSLFQAEARRCKEIINVVKSNPKARHFCIFDELYSGTNPHEAISSAYSYLLYLSKSKKIKFVLTTHFTRLCKLLKKHKNIRNNHMKTTIINSTPQYSYKMAKGISDIKGGLCVLEQLNYPREILNDANDLLKQM